MSTPIVSVTGLGKEYLLQNQGKKPTYNSLRENLANSLRRMVRSQNDPRYQNASKEVFWALKDVSFDIAEGEILGVIGRNGAGKSTLLKILSRITEPSQGKVELRGRIASLLEVGTGFHPELTGRENIYLNGAILGMRRHEIARKFDEIVDFAEVERFLDTPVKRYSSGMYVRLAFAVAAHLEPEILVVDEVLAVGDADFQKKCMGRMKDVASSGRTIIFVSHSMSAIELLCTSALLLKKGQVAQHSKDVRSVINGYLGNSNEDAEESSWRRSSEQFDNDYFSPQEIVLRQNEANPVPNPFNRGVETFLEITAQIKVRDPSLTVGYDLYNEEGFHLYRSYMTDGPEKSWPSFLPGTAVFRCALPQFLNEGTYSLALAGGLHHREWIFEPGKNVPGIRFKISGGLSESPYWLEKRSGLTAPVLPWMRIH